MLIKNIIANYIGTLWMTILSLALVPIYISFLGIEMWGLIGLFTTILSIMSLFDFGFSTTISRELSSISDSDNKHKIYNLLKTMEVILFGVGFVLILVFVISAVSLSSIYNDNHELSKFTKISLIVILGLLVSIQLPTALYSGSLLGFQNHVILNKINILISSVRGLGAILVLWLSPQILNFYYWQLFVSLINLIVLNYYVKTNLPGYNREASFDAFQVKNIAKFALGLSGVSILGIFITQSDKLILGRSVTLIELGYYMVASSAASSIVRIAGPVYNSIYPKFSELVIKNDLKELTKLYHKISLILSCVIFPLTFVSSFFHYQIIEIWTGNVEIAFNSSQVFSVLLIASSINGILHIPYALLLAFKWTKLLLIKNILSLIIVLPLIYLLSIEYGIYGAAFALLIINLFDFMVVVFFLHKKILVQERLKWLNDLFVPILISFSVVGLSKLALVSIPNSNVSVHILATLLLTYIIIGFSISQMRGFVVSFFKIKF